MRRNNLICTPGAVPGRFVEYISIPWDLGFRKAKEICFESRFMTAA